MTVHLPLNLDHMVLLLPKVVRKFLSPRKFLLLAHSEHFKSTSTHQSTHGPVKPATGTLHSETTGQSHGAFTTVYKAGRTSFSTPHGQGQITFTKEAASATLQPGRPKVAPFAKFTGLKPEAAHFDRTSGVQSHSSESLDDAKSHGFSEIHKTTEITFVKDVPASPGFSSHFENAPLLSTFGVAKPQSASHSKVLAGQTHSTRAIQKSSGQGFFAISGPSQISFTKDFTPTSHSSGAVGPSTHPKTGSTVSLNAADKLAFPAFETFSTSSASGSPKSTHQVSGQFHSAERSKVSTLSSSFAKKPAQGELDAGYHKSSALVQPAEIPGVSYIDDKSPVSEHTIASAHSGGYSGGKSTIQGHSFSIPVSGEKSITSEKAFVLVPEDSIASGKSSGLLTLSKSDFLNAGKDTHFAGSLVSAGGSGYDKSSKHFTGIETGTLGHSSSAFKHTSTDIPATERYQLQKDKSSACKHTSLVAPEHASFSSSEKGYETPTVGTLNSQRYSSAFSPTSHYGSAISDLSGAHEVHGQISNVAPLYTFKSDSYPTYAYESQSIISPYTYSHFYSS
ncbi:uncharacterized protein LOC118186818 [Stegodyphus dumicola]|uniref:uncharacterized protein LOC118186818 n=1 Tax=Stegodyphus dumicola TaxID=202533 RepID=UPI0015A94BB4|nr:uncharacterized protein LOC118186818 [Stegodyphus dumicola]